MQERGDDGAAILDELIGAAAGDETPPPVADERKHSRQSARRRDALSLHLGQLEEVRKAGGDVREAFDGIELDHWELRQLERGLDGTISWQALVAEGVAFRNKFGTDLGWIPGGQELSDGDATDLRRLLVTDAALGIALLAETQLAVNQLILSGNIDEAKRLTSFRNKIGQSLNDLRDRIGAAGYADAERLSEELITPSEQASWTERRDPAPFTPQKKAPAQAASRPATGRVVFSKVRASSKSHLKPMLMLLGLLVAFWGVFILPRMTTRPLPELTVQDVAPRSEIRHVTARPPSLYVRLDTAGWKALSREQRLELVDDVGRTATAAGYHGAQFTLENGRTAAQWLKQRGSLLID